MTAKKAKNIPAINPKEKENEILALRQKRAAECFQLINKILIEYDCVLDISTILNRSGTSFRIDVIPK